jgi:hypothetical protein
MRYWRGFTNVAAGLAALAVVVAGAILIYLPIKHHGSHFRDDPNTPHILTSTVAQKSGAPSDRPKTTKTIVRTPDDPVTTTLVIEHPGRQTKVTTTVSPDKPSLLERAFGAGGYFIFRVALVAAAAFIAGALVQRTLLAKFAIKLPFVELADLPAATADSKQAIDALRNGLVGQIAELRDTTTARLAAGTAVTEQALHALADVSKAIQDLQGRVESLEAENDV